MIFSALKLAYKGVESVVIAREQVKIENISNNINDYTDDEIIAVLERCEFSVLKDVYEAPLNLYHSKIIKCNKEAYVNKVTRWVKGTPASRTAHNQLKDYQDHPKEILKLVMKTDLAKDFSPNAIQALNILTK